MSELVTLKIDNTEVTVPAGTLIVDAAKKAGIDIPVFCYHPKMEPVGMCRMCLVEIGRPVRDRQTGQPVLEEDGSPKIDFGWKLETACTVPVSEGMVIRNQSEKVEKGRKDIIEFILTSHPLDCPVCDKGGECPLQNLTMEHGSSESRFIFDEKIDLEKNVPLGDLIFLDRERCIQCARCTRFQQEIVDDPVIGFYNRGRSLEIVTFSDPGFDSYWSGNTTDICPVGALTTADFRFGARPWEMIYAASLSPHSPVGANLTLNIRREAKSGGKNVIKRIMPRQNEQVNEIWISDKDRFAYHFYESEDRLTTPLLKNDDGHQPANWNKAIEAASSAIRDKNTLFLVSGRLSNEDLFNLHQLAEGINGQPILYTHMAGGDLTTQFGVAPGTNLSDLGKNDAILVVASDLEEEAPLWWLRVKQAAERGATLIVANPRSTKLDRYANYSIRYAYGQETKTVQDLQNGASEAAKAFAESANAIVFFGSEGIDISASQPLSQACASLLVKTEHTGKANNGLIGVWERPNNQGAWEMGFTPVVDLKTAIENADVVYIAGADPAGDDPELANALRNKDRVIVQELFMTATAEIADIVLPSRTLFEREGTFTSGERRVQRYYPAVDPVGDSKSDFEIATAVANGLGITLSGKFPSQIMLEIARNVESYKGINYQELAKVEQQYPIMDRSDLYYGGTSYQNHQGLGVQLAPTGGELPTGSLPTSPAEEKADQASILAVPVNTLYNRGTQIMKSAVLNSRIPKPNGSFNPEDAKKLGIFEGEKVQINMNGLPYTIEVRVSDTVPQGVVLIPRKMGIPIQQPAPASIQVIEMAS